MGRVAGFVMVALVCSGLGPPCGSADSPLQKDLPQPLFIGDLEPKLDGQEVTVKFTITALAGIAQRVKEGQAPSFAMETDQVKQKNVLSVWIEGELANVLDRLQMGYLQDNQLKAGTTVVATGKLSVHKVDSHLFFLSVTKWQDFRVLRTKEEK